MTNVHQLILEHGQDGARQRLASDDRYLVDLAVQVLGDDAQQPGYLYSGFAMTALPHRRLADDHSTWKRQNGRFTLLVEPGHLLDRSGDAHLCGVPYGSRARLIMLYLQSEAIRTSSAEVRLGATMHDWLERMGIKPGGTSYAAIRDQARRISACRLTVGWANEDGRSGFERANIVSAMMFGPPVADPRQGALWDETARLSPEFFRALRDHPLPVSEAAIKAIQNSSATMDLYVWLCYRLRRVDKPTLVSWPALHQQFGPEYQRLTKFREKFRLTLKEAVAVYADARVEVEAGGVRLLPSHPAVPERTRRIG